MGGERAGPSLAGRGGGVVLANVVWVGASVALVLTEWQHLTTVGVVWVLLQAVVVGAFAAAQGWALTRR
ncbi:hypothetical protein [Rhodococcus sp. JVH1]|uniref:hypothetical protein n=1 Tax=Rhodococcus sp. JVH1 TaxID=745408 RepID=UPI003523AC54